MLLHLSDLNIAANIRPEFRPKFLKFAVLVAVFNLLNCFLLKSVVFCADFDEYVSETVTLSRAVVKFVKQFRNSMKFVGTNEGMV